MGKRSNFERVERDFYPTPREAVLPLVPHIGSEKWYVEPCAGDGALMVSLDEFGMEVSDAYDIEPKSIAVRQANAFDAATEHNSLFITNPPWRRDILHPLIEHLTADNSRAWLLFDADWMHTKQAIPYLPRLRRVVSVGRVKWIPGSKMTGKDNCCWYYFTQPSDEPTVFYGRA